MRVLITSSEGAGHFGPLLPFVEALARRGDELLIAVPPALSDRAAALGHAVEVVPPPPADQVAEIWDRAVRAPAHEAAVLVNREIFGRLNTAAALPTLERLVRDWRPDLVLHEAAEFAGAIAAHRHGVVHQQVAIGLASIEASSLDLIAPALRPYGTDLAGRIRTSPYLTRLPAVLDPSPYPDTRRFREPRPSLDPSGHRRPGRTHQRGRTPRLDGTGARIDPGPSGWIGDDEQPLLYASFGTIAGSLPEGLPAYRAVVAAVAQFPIRVLLSLGDSRDPAELGPLPVNVRAERWVDQDEALARAALVVCHGGAGTTFGALEHGVPLVVVPFMADQPANAALITRAGAGLTVDLRRPSTPDPAKGADPADQKITDQRRDDETAVAQDAARLRSAVERVLADPSYRRAAAEIGAQMRTLPLIDAVLPDLSD